MIDKILPPIIGGIIGYFTNWLAIKMLFLPREPKYIGKFKLPFTPGLIPKERARLSKKIAKVCEENILNKETIEENLFNEKNKEKVYLLIEKNFNNLIEKDYTLNELLEKINKSDILEIIEEKGCKYINNYLENEENQKYISNFLTEKFIYFIKNIDKYEDIKNNINDIILNIFSDEEIKNKLLNKKLNDIISNENISKLKFTIFENIPKICEFFIDKFENNIEFENKIRNIVKDIIEENVGGFAGLFLNSDKIYESIKKNIILNIRNEENQNIIGLKIFEYISSYQNKEIAEIYDKFPLEIKNIIGEKTSKENLQEILNKNFFEKYFKENVLYEMIERNISNFEDKISIYIKNFISNELKDKIITIFKDILKQNKNKILSLKINNILNKFELKKYKDTIFAYIEKFIQKEGDRILSEIHIAEIVENKINSFEISTIENIIISVAKKELNAITIIGGVLGFIIGLIPIFY